MNIQWISRVRLCTLAAAGIALAGVSTAVRADDQVGTRPVTALNGWNGKMRPGLGSVKTPFLVVKSAQPQGSGSDDTLYFHTSTGQAAEQAPIQHLGPGPGSVKSPFSGSPDSSTLR